MAAESGVIDSSVKTVDYNDTVDTEILAKNSETLEKYSGQQKENVYLIRNEKDRSKVFGDIHQVYIYIWNNVTYIPVTKFKVFYSQAV